MINHRFKVLFLASWYPNEDNPIFGIFIKRHAQAVSKYCDVAVLYVHQSQHITSTKVEYSIEDGIKTVRIYARKSPFKNKVLKTFYNLFIYLIESYKGLKFIRKEFGGPDIVHVNVTLPSGLLALVLKYLKGIPYIVTEHWTGYLKYDSQYKGIFNKLLTRLIILNAKAVTTVSNELKEAMMSHKLTNQYYFIIPNVVNTNLLYPLTNKPNEVKKKILHVSLFNDMQKNISGILKGIKLLSEKREDFEFYLVGDGEDREKLEQIAIELRIKNRLVFFKGRISDDELANFLKTSDFFISNSNYETFGIVCVEALASGIPVISTRCGGPEEYINKDVGILIEPGNTKELVRAIDYMLDNHWKYDPIKLHDYVKGKFGYEVVGKQFYDIYRETLKEWKVGFGKSKVEIEPNWLVVDIGSGHNPHIRADVLVDREIESTPDRSGEKAKIVKDKTFIIADGCNLPFKDKSFDFAIACHIAEHVDEPEKFCEELTRISKKGYIETPGIFGEICLNEPYHKWFIYVNNDSLIFKQKRKFYSFNETFYRIFYYKEDRFGHNTLLFKNAFIDSIFKKIKYVLNRSWKFLPETYTYYTWEKKIKCKVEKRNVK